MSYVNIMLHCVWGTKYRLPVLTSEKRYAVIQHILHNANEKGIIIDTINGYTDHLHALLQLTARQNIADVMQLIKGESAFWANNKTGFFGQKFQWADEYYAVSVSKSQVNRVRMYIHNQEAHHSQIGFAEECSQLSRTYGFSLSGPDDR